MNEALKVFLKKVFDLRQGEVLRTLLMQLNIFLIISTLLIVKPTVNGLFLAEMGVEALPLAFVLVAVFAILISAVYSRLLGSANLNRIMQITLGASVFLFILFGILLRFQAIGGWVLFAFYIWVSIFGVLTASQFWILANVVFNTREAKRLFGFIGAGAIAGGIFGGYLTSLLAEPLGSENLIFVGAGLLLICMPITAFIWKKNVLDSLSKYQRRKRISKSDNPFRLVRRSPHLSFLASIIGISVIVAKLVDFQFNAIASDRLTDPDELTAFFGFWFSTFNLVSLSIQLLLTRVLVGRLGVGGSLFFLPVSILIGAIWIFFAPALLAAVFIKMSDASLKQSINKAAVELLALPIPKEIKSQTKTFIDVVVDSIATGISGLMLIFLINGLNLSPRFISILIGLLVVLWFFFVWKIRKSYLQSFRLNVQKIPHGKAAELDLKNKSVVAGLKKVLHEGDEALILETLKKLKNQPDNRFARDFLQLLKHPSDHVKEESIRNLYFIKNPSFVDEVLPLASYPSQAVKIATFDYLIARSPERIPSLMKNYLEDEDYRIRWAALVSLSEESRSNPFLKEKFELQRRIHEAYEEIRGLTDPELSQFYKIGLLKTLGHAQIPDLFSMIEEFFKDENPRVVRQALYAAGMSLHPYFVPILMDLLSKNKLAAHARDALVLYGKGLLPELLAYSQSPKAVAQAVKMIPSIVEQFDSQEATDYLFQLLHHSSGRIRLEALRSLNQQKIRYPWLHYHEKKATSFLLQEAHLYQDTLSVLYVQQHHAQLGPVGERSLLVEEKRKELIALLEKRLDGNLERIFRLLGLKYAPEDVLFAFEGIKSKEEDIRINSLDFLDNLLDSSLKRMLIPLIETALLESISEEVILQLNGKIPNQERSYQMLLKGEDEELKMAVEALLEIDH